MPIVSSAIYFHIKDDFYPTAMCGKRHCDIFEKMHSLNISYDKTTAIQGFLTSAGRFVDRHEAATIAFASGQIKERVNYLYSEDIWPPEKNDTI